MYFNVNFNVFFKLIKVHLLVSELYIWKQVVLPCFNLQVICLAVNIDTVFVSCITGVVYCSKAPDVDRYSTYSALCKL